LSYSW